MSEHLGSDDPMCDGDGECFRLAAELRTVSAERDTLRAERDAAQQQIATLTEALEAAAQDIRDWVKTARGLRGRVPDPDHDPSTPHLRGIVESEQVLTRIYAALSTRPQEQPPEPAEPSKPSEPRKPVVDLMEALKKSLEAATHQQGGHQP